MRICKQRDRPPTRSIGKFKKAVEKYESIHRLSVLINKKASPITDRSCDRKLRTEELSRFPYVEGGLSIVYSSLCGPYRHYYHQR